MPVFKIENNKLKRLTPKDFKSERELQNLIENSLDAVFNAKLVASEFPTGSIHGGRIDTLALSEDGCPIIIEYKLKESSSLINQALFYLAWLDDHHGDYEIAVQKKIGQKMPIDWSNIRVVCLAQQFKKYDLHAVNQMPANLELWQYRLFDEKIFFLEQINSETQPDPKKPVERLSVSTKKTAYTLENHFKKKPPQIVSLFKNVQEYILSLGEKVEEVPKMLYIGYKTLQLFACVTIRTRDLKIWLKLDYKTVHPKTKIARDVSNIGHHGIGDFELTVKNETELEEAKKYIEMSFRKFE